jgi:hypothetical protein
MGIGVPVFVRRYALWVECMWLVLFACSCLALFHAESGKGTTSSLPEPGL